GARRYQSVSALAHTGRPVAAKFAAAPRCRAATLPLASVVGRDRFPREGSPLFGAPPPGNRRPTAPPVRPAPGRFRRLACLQGTPAEAPGVAKPPPAKARSARRQPMNPSALSPESNSTPLRVAVAPTARS